jgi:hypothetical protein
MTGTKLADQHVLLLYQECVGHESGTWLHGMNWEHIKNVLAINLEHGWNELGTYQECVGHESGTWLE